MQKIFTPNNLNSVKHSVPGPKKATLALIRQFARTYYTAKTIPASSLIILN